MTVQLACIVEGHGEIDAVPVLIRRIAAEVDPTLNVAIPKPFRVSQSSLKDRRYLGRFVDIAARTAKAGGGILVLLDADDDCPARLGPDLLAQVRQLRPDFRSALVLAYREFETRFLFAAESLAGLRGLPADLSSPADPEAIRDAKGWLKRQMIGLRTYEPTTDQAALAARMDIAAAR